MRPHDTLAEADLLRFSQTIERRLGLDFDRPQLSELGAIARERMLALGCSQMADYLRLLGGAAAAEEFRALAPRLTTGETYFFRNPEQFNALAEIALPEIRHHSPERPVRILSAGCASGEEPYSVAMTLVEHRATAHATILGIDVNPQAIARARLGRYSAWSVRATPPATLKSHFSRDRAEFVLDPSVRAMVDFEERNLALADAQFWLPGRFEIILCRNVVMYLSARMMSEVVARFAGALTADGFLFLSHVEPLRGITNAFVVEHNRDSFYYRLRSAAPSRVDISARPAAAAPRIAIAARAVPAVRATERLAVLDPPAIVDLPISLGAITALVRAERFDEALAILESLPLQARADPDMLFLMATVLMDRGRLERAGEMCAALLAHDDLNPAAHYLLALCHEHSGRREAALESYRVAVYLDRTFAMPHLRMGLMFRRECDLPAARRELENAAALLAREDPARLLMFSGGFSRRTLLGLCDSELRLCGTSSGTSI